MIYGNLPPAGSANKTSAYFDNFFKDNLGTSSDINDAVIGYFQTLTGNAESGVALASAVLFTAQNQRLNIMELLDQFRKLNKGELNAYLTMFLNLNRSGTSLLGLSSRPQTSKYITRTILP